MIAKKNVDGDYVLEVHDARIEAIMDKQFDRVGPLAWRDKVKVRFDEKTRTFWLIRKDPAMEAALDARYERTAFGELRWVVPPDGFTIDRGIDFLAAKISGKLEPNDPTVLKRLESCNGCEALKRDANGAWCIPCGCGGKNLMIQLDGTPATKMLFRNLNCPRFMAGFSNAVGGQAGE